MAADAREVAESYFAALARRDVEAAATHWAPDGVDDLVDWVGVEGPAGARAFFGELFAAVPDFAFEVDSMLAEGDRVAVRWHATGTFAGEASFQGIAPTGARVTVKGLDLLEVRDGLIVRNEAFTDGLGFARRIGVLPPQGSKADAGDGGPVPITGTVEEGDDVSGFRLVHLPGHAPGLIGLYRERDGLALSSEAFYTLDVQTGLHCRPRVAHAAFNQDTEQARASIRKLAELTPTAAWPGHAEPLRSDVAAQLERAAAG